MGETKKRGKSSSSPKLTEPVCVCVCACVCVCVRACVCIIIYTYLGRNYSLVYVALGPQLASATEKKERYF